MDILTQSPQIFLITHYLKLPKAVSLIKAHKVFDIKQIVGKLQFNLSQILLITLINFSNLNLFNQHDLRENSFKFNQL